MNSLLSETLRSLAQHIEQMESGQSSHGAAAISLGIPALDALLPEEHLPAGSLVELLSTTEGAGASTLALLMAKQACGERKFFVVVDARKCFYPPAAARLGMDLNRSMVVRPATQQDVCAALEHSLRCAAVGAVIGWCPQLTGLEFRRFQLAAEAGGGLGLLLRPASALRQPSFAALRLLIAPIASRDLLRRVQIDVVRCRGGKCGVSVFLEIDDETGHVRVPAEVAAPAAVSRTA